MITLSLVLCLVCWAAWAEWRNFGAALKLHQALGQGFSKLALEQRRLVLWLFLTSLITLSFGLIQASWCRATGSTHQGLAIVIDTSTPYLPIVKGAATEIMQSLQGSPVSLYELRGQSLHGIVPATVDKAFFALMLDSVRSSIPDSGALNNEEIIRLVEKNALGTPPWILILASSRQPLARKGVTVLQITDMGQPRRFEQLVDEMRASFQPSEAVSEGATHSYLISIAVGISWVSFLLWRSNVAPLAYLGVFLGLTSLLYPEGECSANFATKGAIGLAEAGDAVAAQSRIKQLLVSTAEPDARMRLAYDVALLAYLQGDLQQAWQWLQTERQRLPNGLVLEGLVLGKMACEATDRQEKSLVVGRLKEWLAASPPLPRELELWAHTIALCPELGQKQDVVGMKKTLCWLEQAGASQLPVIPAEFDRTVANELARNWSESTSALFFKHTSESQGVARVFAYSFWSALADFPSKEEAVLFVVQRASMAAHSTFFFQVPDHAPKVAELLGHLATFLPKALKEGLLWSIPNNGSAKEWQESVRLWPIFAHLPCDEVQRLVAAFPHGPSADHEALLEAVGRWFSKEPGRAAEWVRIHLEEDPVAWTPVLFGLIARGPKEPLFERSVGTSVDQFDPNMLGLIWQSTSVDQSVMERFTHLQLLYTAFGLTLKAPAQKRLRAFCLAFTVHPALFGLLERHQLADQPSNALYHQLLSSWKDHCQTISAILSDAAGAPRTLRMSFGEATQLLARIIELLRKQKVEQPPQASAPPPSPGAKFSASMEREDAVRLFQEMDRADRELFHA